MKTVVMVAEKPSLAQSIAKILSRGNFSQRKGFSSACAIHEYNAKFQNEQANFKVTSVCGHVMSLDFDAKYNNWEKVDPAELFQATVQKKESNPKLNIPKHLEKECRGADAIVLWLDCDKEGENICFEVLDIVLHVMKRQAVYRAHFSAITDKDINAAMNNLGSPNENESLCVDARQELDLRLGCAFTRFQTKFFQGKYGDLDSSLISYGPCQTPTLGFCVDRHDFIQSFKPENYWVVDVTIKTSLNSSIKLEWGRDRLFDRDATQVFLVLVQQNKYAEVMNVKTSDKVKQRPQALNTVEMLRIASSGLNIGPQQTMQIAERLYTQGYISYPRTETTQYPENFDFRSVLNSNKNHRNWGDYVTKMLSDGYNKPRKGKDVGDHPPITPMRCATESEVGADAWRLYDYICRHFFATLSNDCVYKQTKVQFQIGRESFFCNGVSPFKPGFTDVMPWKSIDEFQTVPSFTVGEKCPIEHSQITDKHTNPPDYLTESEVITLMEKHGIGTDASIPTHINNICQRNYVTVASGRKLVPTVLGIVLVHGYKKVDKDLVLPTMRAAVEKQLDLIAAGKAKKVDVLKHALDIFRQKFHYFVSHVTSVDQLFEVSFSPLSETGRAISRCGKCRRFLKLISAAPTRLYCKICDETYALPQKTSMKLYKEIKCPLDDFELLLCTTGNKGKSYPLCPYCYNNPPFSDMTKNSGCNSCTHPTCSQSMVKLGIAGCVSCETGVLILDNSMPPRWRLICNNSKCTTVILISLEVVKIKVTETQCGIENCEAYNVNVDIKKEQKESRTGCLFCNSDLSNYLEVKKARMTVARPKSGRGRGRGRGGGGRGRKRQPKDKMSQLANYFV